MTGPSQTFITVLLVAGALGAGLALLGTLARCRRELTFPFWFALTAGLLLNGHSIASSLLHGRTSYVNLLGQPDSFSAPWVDALYRRLLILLIVLGVATALYYGLRVRRHVSPVIFVALIILAIAALAGYQSGNGLLSTSQLALAALMLGFAFLPDGRLICLGVGTFGVVIAVLSGFMPLIDYQATIVGCAYKCGALGNLYFGVLGNDNALGLLLAVSLPFAWLGFRGRARTAFSSYIGVSVMVTGSRTAEVAVIALLVVLLIARRDGSRGRSMAAMLGAFAVLLAGMAVGLWLPFSSPDASSFTGRGQLWHVAIQQMQSGALFGLGPKAWSQLYEQTGTISSAATYSPHNQWLDIRFTTGWIGGGLFVILLYMLLRCSNRADTFASILILVPVAYIGITERAWGVGSADWLSFAYVAALVAIPRLSSTSRRTGSPAEHSEVFGAQSAGLTVRQLSELTSGGVQ